MRKERTQVPVITEGSLVRKVDSDGNLQPGYFIVVGFTGEGNTWCVEVANGEEGDLLLRPTASLIDQSTIRVPVDQKVEGREISDFDRAEFRRIAQRLRVNWGARIENAKLAS